MRRFWKNQDGNFAVLFGLAIIPVIGAVGVAVDYSLASSYRTDMQKALDTTALALSKMMPAEQATLDTVGMQYFLANMGQHTLSESGSGHHTRRRHSAHPCLGFLFARIANILGVSTFPLSTESRARWSIGQVEVVLALDNTGSMSGEKIIKLREGAQKLIDILKAAAKKADDAKIAIASLCRAGQGRPHRVLERHLALFWLLQQIAVQDLDGLQQQQWHLEERVRRELDGVHCRSRPEEFRERRNQQRHEGH